MFKIIVSSIITLFACLYERVDLLLAFAKHLHDLIVSLRGRFSPMTSLTTPRFIEVPVSSQEC